MKHRITLAAALLLGACQAASEPPGSPLTSAGEEAWRSFPRASGPRGTGSSGKDDSYSDYRLANPEWYAITEPPAGAFRAFTEWEPLEGTLIAYSDYLTSDSKVSATMADIAFHGAKGAKMFVVHESVKAKDHLTARLIERGMTEAEIAEKIEFIQQPNETIWFVDYGPFPLIDEAGRVAFADKRYYHERIEDDAVPTRLARHFGATSYRLPFSYEWGGFQADDIGTCYSSDRIIQIAQSQTGQTKADLEKIYADYAGCKMTIWLKSVTDDGTGHLDMFFKLADRNTVVHSVYMEPMKMDAEDLKNQKRMEENIAVLEAAVLPDGSKLTVHRLPMPNGAKDPQFGKVPRTYVNSHLVNGLNLWPVYSEDKDIEAMALEVWKQAMPDYEHIGILSDEISMLSGTIHCVTRGIPSLTYEAWVEDGECNGDACEVESGGYTGLCGSSSDCFGPAWVCECNACPCKGGPAPTGCGDVSFEGQCDGTTLEYCDGGTVAQGACTGCCGFDPAGNNGSGWYDCLEGDACTTCIDECEAGETGCSAENTHGYSCSDIDGDGCLERDYSWCGKGGTCSSGAVCGSVPVEPGEDAGTGGGEDAGAGGEDAGVGGEDAGTSGEDAGAGGEDAGTGGDDAGEGAEDDAMPIGDDAGVKPDSLAGEPDASGDTAGAGGPAGSGGSAAAAGGDTGGCAAAGGLGGGLLHLIGLGLAALAVRRRRR